MVDHRLKRNWFLCIIKSILRISVRPGLDRNVRELTSYYYYLLLNQHIFIKGLLYGEPSSLRCLVVLQNWTKQPWSIPLMDSTVQWRRQELANINIWIKTMINSMKRNSRVLWEKILRDKGRIYCGLTKYSVFLWKTIFKQRAEVWGHESQADGTAVNKENDWKKDEVAVAKSSQK